MGGKIHQFRGGDRSHNETDAIYKVLEGLVRRIKLEGFVYATDLVFMDVLEEEKEENLKCHSEKLALAFGVLKIVPGTDIGVSKNLRTCHRLSFLILVGYICHLLKVGIFPFLNIFEKR